MFAKHDFDAYDIGVDPYKGIKAGLRLDDLQPVDPSLPIKLSVMTSTYHRYSQLERSLECLARQDWKEFEVLICDDGDDYDLSPIFEKFSPYLRLKTIRRERKHFHVDPTGGFRALMPLAVGDVWAIVQPEVMLYPEACRLLYEGVYKSIPASNEYALGHDPRDISERWVALKMEFIPPQCQRVMDKDCDWHSDLQNLKSLPEFMSFGCGLSNRPNDFWKEAVEFPWWFVGATDNINDRDLLVSIDQKLAVLVSRFENMEATVRRHDETLYGNGKAGLLTDMTILKDWKENKEWMNKLIVSLVVGEVVVFVAGIVFTIIRTQP